MAPRLTAEDKLDLLLGEALRPRVGDMWEFSDFSNPPFMFRARLTEGHISGNSYFDIYSTDRSCYIHLPADDFDKRRWHSRLLRRGRGRTAS